MASKENAQYYDIVGGSSRLKKTLFCPVCRHRLDGVTDPGPNDALAGPGDATLCSQCVSVLVFGEAMQSLRIATAEEIKQLEEHGNMDQAIALRHLARFFDEEPDPLADGGETLGLGTCCACGTDKNVRSICIMERKAPIGDNGKRQGWGCVVCDLPPEGAAAVLCDECFKRRAPIRYVVRGDPAANDRVPVDSYPEIEHAHDESKHPELRAQREQRRQRKAH